MINYFVPSFTHSLIQRNNRCFFCCFLSKIFFQYKVNDVTTSLLLMQRRKIMLISKENQIGWRCKRSDNDRNKLQEYNVNTYGIFNLCSIIENWSDNYIINLNSLIRIDTNRSKSRLVISNEYRARKRLNCYLNVRTCTLTWVKLALPFMGAEFHWKCLWCWNYVSACNVCF